MGTVVTVKVEMFVGINAQYLKHAHVLGNLSLLQNSNTGARGILFNFAGINVRELA